PGSPAHPLGLSPDGQDIFAVGIDRDDGPLLHHDPPAFHKDQRVGRAQIDTHVPGEPSQHDVTPSQKSQRRPRTSRPYQYPASFKLGNVVSPITMRSNSVIPNSSPASRRRRVKALSEATTDE